MNRVSQTWIIIIDFPQNHKPPQLNPDEVNNLSGSRTIKEVKFVIQKLLEKKSAGSDDFTGGRINTNSTQPLPENMKREHLPIHFMKLVLL